MKKKKKYSLKDKEVKARLLSFEWNTEKETGVSKISGGFARAVIEDMDDDDFFVTLSWGVQSDCEDHVHREKWLMNRETLEITEE